MVSVDRGDYGINSMEEHPDGVFCKSADDDNVDSEWELLVLKPTAAEEKESPTLSRILRWIIVMWLLLAYLACNMGYSLIAPFFPEQAEQKGVSSGSVGFIIASTPLTVVILSPVIGYLLPYFGVLLPIIFGLTLVGVSYVSMAYVILISSGEGFVAVSILLRISGGVGTALYMTSAFAIAPKLFPKRVTVIMGIFQVTCGLGYSSGLALGGILYQVGGFKLPFLFIGIFVLLLIVPCGLTVCRIKSEKKKKKKKTLPFKVIARFLSDYVFIILVLTVIVSATLPTFYTPDIQLYLTKTFNLNSIGVSIMLLIQSFCFSTNSFIASPIVQKLGNSWYFSLFGVSAGSISYFMMGHPFYSGFTNIWIVRMSFVVNAIGASFGLLPIYANLISVAKTHMRMEDNEAALTAFIAGIVSSAILFGESIGAIVGGIMNSFLSYPESCFVFAEFIIAPCLVIAGATIINRLTMNSCHHS